MQRNILPHTDCSTKTLIICGRAESIIRPPENPMTRKLVIKRRYLKCLQVMKKHTINHAISSNPAPKPKITPTASRNGMSGSSEENTSQSKKLLVIIPRNRCGRYTERKIVSKTQGTDNQLIKSATIEVLASYSTRSVGLRSIKRYNLRLLKLSFYPRQRTLHLPFQQPAALRDPPHTGQSAP